MRPHLGLLAVLALAAPARADDALRERAAADVKRFYRERLSRPFIQFDDTPEPKVGPPPWAEPLKQLAAAKPEERARAAAYLRELLALALSHETDRSAPWRNTPFWGGEAELPARDLRKEVARELAQAGPLPDALPVLRWYFEAEVVDGFLPPVVEALGKLATKDADALRAELATRPHPNAVVAAGAIEQITARKGTLPAGRLAALCHHHRAAIREAARKLDAQLGGEDPGPFDPAKAMRSEPVKKVMDDVLALMPELPGPKAEFVTMTVRHLDAKNGEKEKFDETGWLVRRDKTVVGVYTPYGRTESARPGEKKNVHHSEKAKDGDGWVTSEIDITVGVEVTPAKIEDEVRKIEAARTKGEAGTDLSRRGGLTGQFEGNGATLYEAILGAWLYRAGRDADAARVLLPALDSLYADRHLAVMVRHRLGDLAGYRMLVAFAGDRDYPAALAQARLIDRLYPDTRFHAYAKGLADQLPRRADDFGKFKLPTPAEWADLKKALTRDPQIDFLCARLRLLNCFQMGQPGGYDPDATQYAEPCGLADDASWGLGKGKTQVINPLTELRGPSSWSEKAPPPKGLELTLKDIPVLSKHLRDDWYMPIVSFWRDFHPDRNLARTRPLVAELIDELALKDLCRIDRWDGLTAAEIDREIKRINQWAAEHVDKTKAELDWEALTEELAAGADWDRVAERVERLIEQKQVKAYDVMQAFLESARTDDYNKARILRAYLGYDPARAKDLAPKFLAAKDTAVREAAALIVLKAGGDRDRARAALGDVLAVGRLDEHLAAGVEELLKDGSAEARRQAARVFSNPQVRGHPDEHRVRIFRACAAAGLTDPFRFYLPLLDIAGPHLSMPNDEGKWVAAAHYYPSVGEAFAEEVVTRFAPDDPAVKEIVRKFPMPAHRVPELKNWLRSRLGAAKK
jgi:hypothetical protein